MAYLSRIFENETETVIIPNPLTFTGACSFTGGVTIEDDFCPTASDGAALGSTTLMWSDLFLASGGVINWNNGDVTITHSTNTLAFAGASSGYTLDSLVTITSTNANALAVGANGTTNPVLKVNASTSSVATGISITGAAAAGGIAVAAISSGTNENLTIDAKGSGTITLGATSTGAVQFSRNAVPTSSDGAALGTGTLMWSDLFLASAGVINFNNGDVTITHGENTLAIAGASSGIALNNLTSVTSTDGSAFTVGANGSTNPVLKIDASTASVATGVSVTGAAAAGGVAVAVISSGTNENLLIDAKGSGVIRLGATSTGAVEFSSAAVPTTTDGVALGSTSLMWSDLFLASGAVINFNNGDVTLTHKIDCVTFSSSMADANMSDGSGMWEVDCTLTGTTTGHAAAASAWVNIGSGVTAAAGNYVCARNDGVYEDAGGTITNAKIIFGARMQKQLGDTDALTFPWSINTGNAGITALIDCSGTTTADLSVVENTGSDTNTLVPFARDGSATKYIKLYDLA